MNYWHMQLHPNDKNGYSKKDILDIIKTGYVGIDIDTEYANELNVNDKPFNEWDENTLNNYNEKNPKWKSQITSFLNLKKNNIVLVRHGEQFVALVKIIDNYIFEQNHSSHWFRHKYKVEILSTYLEFNEVYTIAKAQQTFEISKTGQTFEIINEIYNRTIKGKDMQEKTDLLKNRNQIILQGPPGTGKTRVAKQMAISMINSDLLLDTNDEIKNSFKVISDQVKLIQFHPSYSYEDFVRGIVAKSTTTGIEYKTENKVLVEMAEKALNDEDKRPYILIIDEINRANLSSVLGELIYALEYRNEAVESMYALEDGSREIILPSNLYIIGTMNTADRSVGHIDYAIRRRFAFESVLPDESVIDLAEGKTLFSKVEEIFENISMEFDKDDVMLGHSYFIAKNTDELKEKLEYQVKPLLREYLKDGVLKDEAKTEIDALSV